MVRPSVIFDLDGTLADTSRDLIAAANVCFRQMGYGAVLDPARDAAVALRGGRCMLTVGLERVGAYSDHQIDAFYPVLLKAYAGAISTYTTLYPGAMRAVDALKEDGFAVGICTNKPEGLARQLLSDLGVLDAFASLVGADTLPVRKPDPAPLRHAAILAGGSENCILIGDSDTDRNTARAAGVPCVLVSFGPSGEDMAALEPEAVLDDFSDLPDLAPRLLSGET